MDPAPTLGCRNVGKGMSAERGMGTLLLFLCQVWSRLNTHPCCSASEASKLVMSYVAAVCGKGQEVNKVKEQLLQSNPVLEGESQVHVCSLECLVAG